MKKNFKNNQHPTSNIQHPVRRRAGCHWMFGVGCWMLDVSKIGAMAVAMIFIFTGCSKPAADKPADGSEKADAEKKAGVTIDAETQARIGLKMENPAAAQWQPGLHAVGRVADPLAFTAAAADYESARAAAHVSQSELERTQKLAAQDNASPRALEAAQSAAARDALALTAARAKFTGDWGVHLAAGTNLSAFASQLQTDDTALIKLVLPAGIFPNPLPSSATVFFLGNETNSVAAEFADDLGIDPATQAETLLFAAKQKLPPSISVTAELKISGEPVGGVTVPADAVLRHDGRGWVFVQSETNQFVRVEIPLDRRTDGGWFVSENLSATNRIVVSGAQTILSAELGGGKAD
jgi:hypothetical protein